MSGTIANERLADIYGSANLTVDNKLTISAADKDSTGFVIGLSVMDNAQVSVAEGTIITINSTSQSAMSDDMQTRYGIYLHGDAQADLGQNSLVSIGSVVDGGFVAGACLDGNTRLTGHAIKLNLNNKAGDAHGLYVFSGNNNLIFDQLEIISDGQNTKGDAFSSGIFSYLFDDGRTSLKARDLEITTVGTIGATAIDSYGAITIENEGQTILKASATEATSSNAYGINAIGTQKGDIDMTFGALTIDSLGAYNATGIAFEAAGEGDEISAQSLAITALGEHDSYGINWKQGRVVVARSLDVNVMGKQYAKGMEALNGARLEVGKDQPQGFTTIATTGDRSYGIDIGRGESGADFFNKTIITAQSTGKQAFGVFFRSELGNGSTPMTGKVAFHNGLTVAVTGGTDDNKAIYVHGPGAEFIVENGLEAVAEETAVFARGSDAQTATTATINQKSGTTQILSKNRAVWAYGNAKIDVGGDVVQVKGKILSVGTAEGTGVVNANFTSSESYLTGTTSNKSYADVTTDGIVNLSFASGACWNVTGNSVLNTLSLDDAAIDLTQDDNQYSRLDIAELKGSGTFRMDVDIDGHQNDTIFVGSSTEGASSHKLVIASSGNASADKSAVLITAAAGSKVDFALRNTVAGEAIDLGNYRYELVHNEDSKGNQEWSLAKAGLSPSAEAVLAMAGSGAQTAQFLG